MKKLFAIALLSLAAASANAAGSYVLTAVTAYNPFSPSGSSVLIGPVATGGEATVDSLGNVSAADIQFSFVALFAYNYTGGVWSAVVGGTSVGHTETCVESLSVSCSGALSGLSGIWNSTQQNGGAASNVCSASAFFGAGNCDRVSVVEVPGDSLTVIEQSEFAISGLPSGFIYHFSVVPVPGAVWLFGSALGVMGAMRRKADQR
jgi:hypothetical protein